MSKKFLDTSSVMEWNEDLTDCIISSITLDELENIKVSANKDDETKYKARQAVKAIERDSVYIVNQDKIDGFDNDNLIMISALNYQTIKKEPLVVYSEDYLFRLIAKSKYELETASFGSSQKELYKGYKVIDANDEQLVDFYADQTINYFNCVINEYIIVDNDIYKWNGYKYESVPFKSFKSRMFGTVKPLDNVQRCAFDSILDNDITLLYGRAGSGKTTIPLAYIMQGLETQKLSKCHCVFHYEPLKNAKTLGFVKGDQTEKKLNTSSLGNILTSKFGDDLVVKNMMATGQLNIMGTYEIRGFEAGENDVIYCSECQNIDAYTLKTIIQRAKKGCKIILEGDIVEQSDINRKSGVWKMINVFKGHKSFGCIKLKNNYRNEISELADKLTE